MSNSPCMAIETSRELVNTIISHGINKKKLINISGIDINKLEQSESRYSVSQHLTIWQAVDKLLPCAGIALKMGEQSDPYNRGIVGLVFAASENLKSAITNKLQYTKILAEHIHLDIEYDEEHFTMHYSINAEYFHSYEIERVFSGFLNWVRIFVNKKVSPVRICCQYAKPHHVEQYQKTFNCPVHFEQPENKIVFKHSLLTIKNPQFNNYLYSILKSRADNVLTTLDNNIDFIDGINSLIASRLCKNSFSAEDIAKLLNMSKRSFYRKLQHEDCTYQQLLDEQRKKMALAYLNKTSVKLQNLPTLLGYADQRSFTRAFKRWMNCSPKEYLLKQ